MDNEPDESTGARARRIVVLGLALSIFLIVLGANWAVVGRYGSDMPNWDQWDAEGLESLGPWLNRDHFVQHLFHPQNEHRVVLTKLENLALTLMAGQWDARVQCVANAALHAAIGSIAWMLAIGWLCRSRVEVSHRDRDRSLSAIVPYAGAFLITAALFGLPISWQNIVSGFHSQQYWLIGLSVVAIAALPWVQPFRPAWWGSVAVAVLALFSMASGMFAALTILVLLLVRWAMPKPAAGRDSPPTSKSRWPTAVVSATIVAVGFATRVSVSYHESLKAHSLHDFLLSVIRSFAWPVRDHDWAAIVVWLPWLLIATYVVGVTLRFWPWNRSGTLQRGDDRAALSLFGVGGWVLAQFIATAYARGTGGDYPQPRYMDTAAVGAWVNGIAALWIVARPTRLRPVLRAAPYALLVIWAVMVGTGLYPLVTENIRGNLPYVRDYYREAEAHLRGYLATSDPAELAFERIPYPSAGALIERLQHRELRALMPVSVRPPLPMKPAEATSAGNGAFAENRATELRLALASHHGEPSNDPVLASIPTWGSFTAAGTHNTGAWRSAFMTASLNGWLKFEVAGDLGASAAKLSLELRDASTHALLGTVRPSKVSGDSWRAAYVKAPRQPFIVEAQDQDPDHWFAFSAPVEMSNLSYWAWQGAKNGLIVLELGAVAGVGLAAAALLRTNTRPNS